MNIFTVPTAIYCFTSYDKSLLNALNVNVNVNAAVFGCRVARLTSLNSGDSQKSEWDRLDYDQKGGVPL